MAQHPEEGHHVSDNSAPNDLEVAEKLLGSVNDAGRMVRNLYITFLLLSTYIGIIIASTTDEQLLRQSRVTLPLLNVDLPIDGFYLFVPWAYLLFHFNLMLHLTLLARRVHFFDGFTNRLSKTQSRLLKEQLFNFPFINMLSGPPQARWLKNIQALIVWITVIFLPLGLILAAQVWFLPYHDSLALWAHRAAVLVDVALIVVFWARIASDESVMVWWWRQLWDKLLLGSFSRSSRKKPEATASNREEDAAKRETRGYGAGLLTVVLVATVVVSLFVVNVPRDRVEAEHPLLDLRLELDNRLLIVNELPARMVNVLRERHVENRDQALQEAVGLKLEERDLRFAQLGKAILPKANLQGAKLHDANLVEAQLQGANLQHAQLEGADLTGAQLQGADLGWAGLQNADLSSAQLQGAILTGARLQGARLNGAGLQGADLKEAELHGAELIGTKLQGADLRYAKLHGANLSDAQLQGAELNHASVAGADFGSACVDFADLRDLDTRAWTEDDLHGFKQILSSQVDNPSHEAAIIGRLESIVEEGVSRNFEWQPGQHVCSNRDNTLLMDGADESQIARFRQQRSAYLIELACDDFEIARSLVRRISNEPTPQSIAFARSLLAARDECKAIRLVSNAIALELRHAERTRVPGPR